MGSRGSGRHCIPLDPYYLSWLACRYDFETSFITLSARTNEDMPFYVVDAVVRALANTGVKVSIAKVLGLLFDAGFEQVDFTDPHVDTFSFSSQGGEKRRRGVELDANTVAGADVVVLITDHSAFPYAMIADRARLIVDTRNAFARIPHDRDKILLLGGGDF